LEDIVITSNNIQRFLKLPLIKYQYTIKEVLLNHFQQTIVGRNTIALCGLFAIAQNTVYIITTNK